MRSGLNKAWSAIKLAVALAIAAWVAGTLFRAGWAWHRWMEMVMLKGAKLAILGVWPFAAALLAVGLVLLIAGAVRPALRSAAVKVLKLAVTAFMLPVVCLILLFVFFGFFMDRTTFLCSALLCFLALSLSLIHI